MRNVKTTFVAVALGTALMFAAGVPCAFALGPKAGECRTKDTWAVVGGVEDVSVTGGEGAEKCNEKYPKGCNDNCMACHEARGLICCYDEKGKEECK